MQPNWKTSGTSPRGLDRLQLFAWLEPNGLTRRNINLLTGARVTADSRLARLDVEDAEAAEFDPAAAAQGTLYRFKDRLHSLLGLSARYVRTGDNCVHDVELDHATPPACKKREGYANTGI